jgi:hypothetical protein
MHYLKKKTEEYRKISKENRPQPITSVINNQIPNQLQDINNKLSLQNLIAKQHQQL